MGELAEKLKDLRIKKRFTLEDVAKLANVSAQTIFKYENGIVTNIPVERIEQLAKIYNVNPGYLMGWVKDLYNHASFKFEYDINSFVYVPIKFKDLNLKAIELLDDSMNKIIVENSVVLFNTDVTNIKDYNNKICAIEYQNQISIQKLVFIQNYVLLNPESYNDLYKPKIITDIENIKLIGNAIWHYNSDKIENYY